MGPAGVGKTQLCLTMAAVAGLPMSLGGLGEGTGVIYLDTERKFSAQRLVEIAKMQAPTWYDSFTASQQQGATQGTPSQSQGDPEVDASRVGQLLNSILILQPAQYQVSIDRTCVV